jgi:hypothetical protein
MESNKGRYACRRTRIYAATHISVRLVQQRITIDFQCLSIVTGQKAHESNLAALENILCIMIHNQVNKHLLDPFLGTSTTIYKPDERRNERKKKDEVKYLGCSSSI